MRYDLNECLKHSFKRLFEIFGHLVQVISGMSDDDQVKRDENGRFVKGHSGYPSGKPRGTKNKLVEDFIKDLYADWKTNGKQAITDVREKDTSTYLRVVAAMVPKEIDFKATIVHELEAMTDEQICDELARLRAATSRDSPTQDARTSH